ncbi:MAG: thiamine diphosphokinase [Thermovirgaceae bacterium]|mgnify:CR=1 FL=1|nr:thiamine diphosphokinase [Synergistales bacterium]HPC75128.1 thiamine diphosphokinase [Synergistales bacterium]HRS48400.1 thiamine diphosphokinase [Thermovirgaceae bacterium]HRU90370.1 thiamine diphosphokinase [Thermovirgaceae bacterium]
MTLISLPQLKAQFTPPFELPSIVFVAGGRTPGPSWLRELCREKDVWAVDRGLDPCMAAGIRPSFFIGDNDSVSEEARQWSREGKIPSLLYSPEKYLTDLQLALKEAGRTCRGPNGRRGCTAILTGAFGGRFDHLFANLYSLIWAEEEWGMKVRCVADGSEALFILKGGERLRLSGLEKGGIFSTLALSEKCLGIRMTGTRWTISEGNLYLRKPFAVSNVAETTVEVGLSSGWLGIYWATREYAEREQKGRS